VAVPRRDAERNRARLIEIGRGVLAELGPDAPLEEIARRAGVGIGTLYRHFPTREALVASIFAEHMEEVLAAAEDAAEAEDGWAGIVDFLERALELQARNLPLRSVFLRIPKEANAERRERIKPALDRAVARAKEQGSLREDFAVGDLVVAMWSFAPIFEATAAVAPNVWRRHLRIVLDGMRPEGATAQNARPLAGKQLERAIDALRSRYHRRKAARLRNRLGSA
jgi:AcrR family transcriptional regulator